MSSMKRCQFGFTLVEVLVVIAIVAVLIAMLMPAIAKAKETSRRQVCASNSRQVIMTIHIWATDDFDRLPSRRNVPRDASVVAPGTTTNGLPYYASGTTYAYTQRYMAQRYMNGDYRAFKCPSSFVSWQPEQIWAPGYFSQMAFSGFMDYKNNIWQNAAWGRGAYDAYTGDQIRRDRTVSPSHKILWMDSVDGGWNSTFQCIVGTGMIGGYYDQVFDRHDGGINTTMLDGHLEWHRDADLGTGDGEYNNTVKRYWWAFNVEK